MPDESMPAGRTEKAMEPTPSTAVPSARQRDTLTVVTIAVLVTMTAIMGA
jgi:hypothetical protein